jgi:hypothetical protein
MNNSVENVKMDVDEDEDVYEDGVIGKKRKADDDIDTMTKKNI